MVVGGDIGDGSGVIGVVAVVVVVVVAGVGGGVVVLLLLYWCRCWLCCS